MPLVAITREMGAMGTAIANALADRLSVPVVHHEIIDHLADKMRVRKSHVVRFLEGATGFIEKLTADNTSIAIFNASELLEFASLSSGVILRGWGAAQLLRPVGHAVRVRICAPFEVRVERMMQRLQSDDRAHVEREIRMSDAAHGAIVRRFFDIDWQDASYYDIVLNTARLDVDRCVDMIETLVRAPRFAETEATLRTLNDMKIEARIRAALRADPVTRNARPEIRAKDGCVMFATAANDDVLRVVKAVEGVQSVEFAGL